MTRQLKDADPWLGDVVRLPDGREGRVRGATDFPDGRSVVHVQLTDGSWADDVPETDAIVTVPELPLALRYGRDGCWRAPNASEGDFTFP